MAEERTLKNLYSVVDQRQSGTVVSDLTQRLRAEHGIATSEGMVGVREVAEATRMLRLDESSALIDLGCGSAEPSRTIASETGCSLFAVDIAIDRLKRIPRSESVHAACVDINGRLPFRDRSVSAAVQFDSIVHVADRGSYLRDLRRVMHAGAGLALTSSTNAPLTNEDAHGLGDVAGTIWRLSTAELTAALEHAGWTVTEVRSRRAEMIAFHAARRDTLLAARDEIAHELPVEGFERLVARASTVARLLESETLDMVFVTATC